jgi:hypothetical protein
MTVDGFDAEVSNTNIGIPQGSPVSPILLATYLSCLFPFVEDKVDGVEGISFADDVRWWVSGKDIGEIRCKIGKCASLSQKWAQNNAIVVDIDKTEFVLFSRRRKMNRASKEGIQIALGILKSFNSHAIRWLGVWIDTHLSLKEHHTTMMSKACRAEARVRSLRGKFGLSPENIRKIQVAAVQAVALYGAELWWDERKNHSRTSDLQKFVNRQS